MSTLERLNTRAFLGALALLFAVSAALPFACCASMSKAEMAICGQATFAVWSCQGRSEIGPYTRGGSKTRPLCGLTF
jgi:hypothetical protein